MASTSLAPLQPTTKAPQDTQAMGELVQQLLTASSQPTTLQNLKTHFKSQIDDALMSGPMAMNLGMGSGFPTSSLSSMGSGKTGLSALTAATGSGLGNGEEDGRWELSGMTEPGNPLTMEDEVKGQKDYFRRLKFKYQEQSAKYHFLSSITSEDPPTQRPEEVEEADKANAEKKAVLKRSKEEVEGVRVAGVELAGELSLAHGQMIQETEEAASLQKEIEEMESELNRLRTMYPPEDRLTTTQAESLLESQVDELQSLEEDLKLATSERDTAREEVTRLAKENARLGRERDREEVKAKEARKGLEKGDEGAGRVDELCRWYTSAIELYQQLLGIKDIKAVGENELHLEYTTTAVPITQKGQTVILSLFFDTPTRCLVDASLLNSDVDIGDCVLAAAAKNDVPGLIADVLSKIRPA